MGDNPKLKYDPKTNLYTYENVDSDKEYEDIDLDLEDNEMHVEDNKVYNEDNEYESDTGSYPELENEDLISGKDYNVIDELDEVEYNQLVKPSGEKKLDPTKPGFILDIFKTISKGNIKQKELRGMDKMKYLLQTDNDYESDEDNEDKPKDMLRDTLTSQINEVELIRKLKRKGFRTNQSIMNEVSLEWKYSKLIAETIWVEAIKKIQEENMDNENGKSLILSYIFSRCECFDSKNSFVFENIENLHWIERWKLPILDGGKMLYLTDDTFKGSSKLKAFQNFVADELNSQELKNDIYPISYINLITLNLEKDEEFEKNFRRVGEIKIKPKLDVYNFESMIKDIADIDSLDTTLVKDKVKNIKLPKRITLNEIRSKIFQSKIMKAPLKSTKPLKLQKQIRYEYSFSGHSPLSNQTTSKQYRGVNVIKSVYGENVIFLDPYKDPDFTFVGNIVEYWKPQVYMQTGLKVFNVKEEILSNKKISNKVYIKLQKVNVNTPYGDTDNPNESRVIEVLYYRKFLDFTDFLKAWQITYVKMYNEAKNDERRSFLLQRIKDIKSYFENVKSEPVKMSLYLNDTNVNELLTNKLPGSKRKLPGFGNLLGLPRN